jgi:hypothetical protein
MRAGTGCPRDFAETQKRPQAEGHLRSPRRVDVLPGQFALGVLNQLGGVLGAGPALAEAPSLHSPGLDPHDGRQGVHPLAFNVGFEVHR